MTYIVTIFVLLAINSALAYAFAGHHRTELALSATGVQGLALVFHWLFSWGW